MNELDMIRGLLDEAPPSAEVFAEGRHRIAAGSARPRHPWPRWVLAGTGLVAAAAAVTATAVAVAGPPSASPRTAGPPTVSPHAHFGPATTPSGVLRNAALAALRLPAGAPRPDQFVYTKLYRLRSTGAPDGVVQTWASADGTRLGLEDDGVYQSGAFPACRNGFWVIKAVGQPAHQSRLRCNPAENAAYQPTMPTSPAPLRSYLHQQFGLWPGDSGGLLTSTENMITTGYLTPAQRAALYRLLAQTRGLTVVPHVTNVKKQTGVGVRSRMYKGGIYTIIFDRRTFAPLGMNWTVVTGPGKGTLGGEVVLKTAIVDSTPPLP
jgi:hypothetical protein